MRTFASEAQRIVRLSGLAEPDAAQLGAVFAWLLFRSGQLTMRRRRRHGRRPWRSTVFRGGTYGAIKP